MIVEEQTQGQDQLEDQLQGYREEIFKLNRKKGELTNLDKSSYYFLKYKIHRTDAVREGSSGNFKKASQYMRKALRALNSQEEYIERAVASAVL